jgi:hypothetical protein
MNHQLRIDQLSKDEKRQIQRDLIALGFLDPELPSGLPADDGKWGPLTDAAYTSYWASRQAEISVPVVAPAPEQPWWVSGTHWSLIAIVASGLLGLAGYAVDSGELTQTLATVAATIAGIIGMIRNAKRKAPIDQSLVARVGGRDIRLPQLRRDPLPPRRETEYRDPRGSFSD